MSEVKVLNFYEQKLCQFRGLYGFTEAEAWKKTYNIDVMTEEDLEKAKRFFRKKKIKEVVEEYTKERLEKSTQIAMATVGYEKADAMRQLQAVMTKCENSMSQQIFPESVINRIKAVLVGEDKLVIKDVYDGREIVEKADPDDVKLYRAIIGMMSDKSLDTKAGELYTKSIRLASELYNLVNTDVNLKVDEETAKAIKILEKFDRKDVEAIAFGDE